jgi:hypothetical protein
MLALPAHRISVQTGRRFRVAFLKIERKKFPSLRHTISRYEDSLEFLTRTGQVPGPADEFHDGVLVDGLSFPADRDEVSVSVRTEEEVFRVQRPHVVGGSSTSLSS